MKGKKKKKVGEEIHVKLGWKVKKKEKGKKRIVDRDERRWYSKMNGKLKVMDITSLKPCNVSSTWGTLI
jgi:hypothetical protein